MDGNNVKKDDENGQLDGGIYSSPAAAGLLARLGQRSLDYCNHKILNLHGTYMMYTFDSNTDKNYANHT